MTVDLHLNIQKDDSGYHGLGGGYNEKSEKIHRLCEQLEECIEAWRGDPTYHKATQKAESLDQELQYLNASPGKRAAYGAANHAGQEPKDYQEEYS